MNYLFKNHTNPSFLILSKRVTNFACSRTPMPAVTPGAGPSRASIAQKGNSVRQSVAPPSQNNIVQMITRVLAEMEKLEGNIRRAEAGRAQAEGELLEVAMYKQASDEALESVVTDMKGFLPVLAENVSNLQSIISHAPFVSSLFLFFLSRLTGSPPQTRPKSPIGTTKNELRKIKNRYRRKIIQSQSR